MKLSDKSAVFLGTAIELYDYAIYSNFTKEIGVSFFPNGTPKDSLLYSFFIFALAYIVRPFGGIIFSHFSDKYGRKKTLFISMLLMIISTALIGIVPPASQIGVVAPIILIVSRIMQGLAISGEFVSGMVYAIEKTKPENKGLVGSMIFMFGIVGMLSGMLMHVCLTMILSPEQILDWGWRLPFFFGLPLYFIAIYIRKNSKESQEYINTVTQNKISNFPLKDSIIKFPKAIFLGTAITLFSASVFYTCIMFMPVFLSKIISLPEEEAYNFSIINTTIYMIALPFFGYLSDKFGRKKVLGFGALFVSILVVPYFYTITTAFKTNYLIAFLFAPICAAYIAPIPALLSELYPPQYRNSSISVVYNTSISLIGSLAPLISLWLVYTTKLKYSPSFYVLFFSAPIILFFLSNVFKYIFSNRMGEKWLYMR